jgi:hypothetical protein
VALIARFTTWKLWVGVLLRLFPHLPKGKARLVLVVVVAAAAAVLAAAVVVVVVEVEVISGCGFRVR